MTTEGSRRSGGRGLFTIQRVGKATAAPVKLDGGERLLLEQQQTTSTAPNGCTYVCIGDDRHTHSLTWTESEFSVTTGGVWPMEAIISAAEMGFTGSLVGSNIP